jgi:hypothetical protein
MRAANPGRTRFENGGTDDNAIQNATVIFLEGFPVENGDESPVQMGQSTHARLLDPTGKRLAQSQRIHVAQLIVAGAENGPGVVSDDALQAGYRHDHFAKKKFKADEHPAAVQNVRNAFDEQYCGYVFQGGIAQQTVETVLSTTPEFAMNAEQIAAEMTRMGVSLNEHAFIQDRSNKEAHFFGFFKEAGLDGRCFVTRSSQDAGVFFVAVRPGQTVMVATTGHPQTGLPNIRCGGPLEGKTGVVARLNTIDNKLQFMRKMLGFPKSPYASATIARRIADEEGTAKATVVNFRAAWTAQLERGHSFDIGDLPPAMRATAVGLGVSADTVRHNRTRPTQGEPNIVQTVLSKLGEKAGKASHAPGNVKGTNRPRMPTIERLAKAGSAPKVNLAINRFEIARNNASRKRGFQKRAYAAYEFRVEGVELVCSKDFTHVVTAGMAVETVDGKIYLKCTHCHNKSKGCFGRFKCKETFDYFVGPVKVEKSMEFTTKARSTTLKDLKPKRVGTASGSLVLKCDQ